MCTRPDTLVPYYDRQRDCYTYRFCRGDSLAYFRKIGKDGSFELSKTDIRTGEYFPAFNIGCGKCPECVAKKKNETVLRCLLELEHCHNVACFITCTLDDKRIGNTCGNMGTDVSKEVYQKFLKRLRKYISEHYTDADGKPLTIKFKGCGEYGSKRKRAHYHFLIFGWKPSPESLTFARRSAKGNIQFHSSELSDLWDYGEIVVGYANAQSVAYICKDLQKLRPLAEGRTPPFSTQSNRPGLGWNGFDGDFSTQSIYRDGHEYLIPRYFVKKAEKEGLLPAGFIQQRGIFMQNLSDCRDNSPENLKKREKLQFERLTKRTFHAIL